MKLQTALAAASCLASGANAIGGLGGMKIPGMGSPPKRPDGKPAPVPNWKWTDPFHPSTPEAAKRLNKFAAVCSNEKTFHAEEFLLDDLSEKPPHGILGYREGLKKVFSKLEYPGSWDGVDPHGYDRNLLMMAYDQVPLAVREWIEDRNRKEEDAAGLYAVFERAEGEVRPTATVSVAATPSVIPIKDRAGVDDKRIVIFAPGALYETLPLWVAEGSGCDSELLDISKYSPKPNDLGVIAYPTRHTTAKRRIGWRAMEFTVRADLLKLKRGEKLDPEIDAPAPKVEKKEETAVKTEEKKEEKKEEAPKTEEKKEEAPKEEEKKTEAAAEKDEL
ncbi:Glucarate dehydratase [Rhypophila decipiens]|uniref:Glucarate dehydratase n=1 Tax=Rhypophila decipiens TaxID=261697 RepID=A0AAN7B1S8_9PEZI|nr:Glucarate dehydratase [Rhypophila decipiens]